MRFVHSPLGAVAVQVSADDVVPPKGVRQRDLLEQVSEHYAFAIPPQIPSGVPPTNIPMYTFQSGSYEHEDQIVPIIQLSMVPNGDIVHAFDTDAAELVLNDFMYFLDERLGYRFSETPQKLVFLSSIVVQFDEAVEERIEAIGKIERLLAKAIPRPEQFKIKKLEFGCEAFNAGIQPQPHQLIEFMAKADFTLDRRANEPYSQNRYFSTAPLRTQDHIKLLEDLERELGGKGLRNRS